MRLLNVASARVKLWLIGRILRHVARVVMLAPSTMGGRRLPMVTIDGDVEVPPEASYR